MEFFARDLIETDFLSIDKSEPLSKLIGKVSSSGKDTALVFDGKSFQGIVSKRELARKNININVERVESVCEKIRPFSPDTSIFDLAETMYSTGARVLPVVNEGKIIGTVSSISIIKKIPLFAELKQIKLRDIASYNFIFLRESDSLGKAISLMKKNNVKKIPVVGSSKKILGIVRFEDIMFGYLNWASAGGNVFQDSQGRKSGRKSSEKENVLDNAVMNYVNPGLSIVDENASISDIVGKFSSESSCVLICQNDLPAAIITHRDLLSTFVKARKIGSSARSIQLINAPKLDEIDSPDFEKSILNFYDRAKMLLNNEIQLVLQFKEQKSHTRSKHFVHVRLSFPGTKFVADYSDWKFMATLQKTLAKLNVEIKKYLNKRMR